jgi:hypothetical protein
LEKKKKLEELQKAACLSIIFMAAAINHPKIIYYLCLKKARIISSNNSK